MSAPKKSFAKFRLKVWQKLALIALPVLVPISVLLFITYNTKADTIRVANAEKRGLEYNRKLRKLLDHLQQHRGSSNAAIGGDLGLRATVMEKQTLINQDFVEIDAVDAKFGAEFKTTEEYNRIKTEVNQLKNQIFSLNTDKVQAQAESKARHNKLILDIASLMTTVGERSGLVLDPEVTTYWLQLVMFDRIPATTDNLGLTRFNLAAIAGKPTISPAQKQEIEVLMTLNKSSRESIARNMVSIYASDAAVKAKLDALYTTYYQQTEELENYYRQNMNDPSKMVGKEVFQTASRAVDACFTIYDTADAEMERLLDQRIVETRGSIITNFVIVAVSLLVVAGIAFVISRSITKQLSEIGRVFGLISAGEFKARAARQTEDELGDVAIGLNGMLDRTVNLLQTKDEKEQIQSSIMKLLEEVSGVADGDLTKEAEVTADMTGAIADSFNYMILQLRDIIGNVKNATLQVSTAASQIQTTAEHLAGGSEEQAAQIINTSVAVEEMAASIQQVSDNAVRSSQVAESAKNSAKQGTKAVQDTIEGMGRIREQVQETAKRIKRLGESSQQIGEIVQLIDDIAERTSLLALNASIQAAMAGEAGRGFAVVAQEVERLAERSTSATKKIGNLVKTIQTETNEAITAMEEGTREVVEGSKLANQAGQALARIEDVSTQLDELIKSISTAAKQQARASEGVAQSMTHISEVTQQTAAGTKQAAVSVNQLADMADSLRGSVERFRLPSERNGKSMSL
jgi:twitching motility protein PilJ